MNQGTVRALCGVWVLAISLPVLGQEAASASPESPAGTTNELTAAAAKEPTLRWSGTDLHIGKLPPVSFHGFLSQGFLYSGEYNYLGDTRDGSFEFTELGLNASVSPFERTRIAVQGFAFDLGEIGDREPFWDYALAEYTFADAFGLRAGRIRRPGGIYNHIQDVDLARTFVLLPQGVYDARNRSFTCSLDGGEAFGSVSLHKAGGLSYEVFGGEMRVPEDGGVGAGIRDRLGSSGHLDRIVSPSLLGGQMWWHTPLDGLRAGVCIGQMFDLGYDTTLYSPVETRYKRMGDLLYQQYSLEYLYKNWTFQAEYYTHRMSVDIKQDGAPAGSNVDHPETYYLSAAYRFNKFIEVGTYYSEYYRNKTDHDGDTFAVPSDAKQRDLAVALRYDPTDWWILKIEGHYISGTALLQDVDGNPKRDGDGWLMLALKTTFSF